MTDWILDLKTGLRRLRRAPGVGVAAVLTLAVGIGATTGVFSVVTAILSASQRMDDMDRRVALWSRSRGEKETKRAVSSGDFLDWRERARQVDQMVASRRRSFNWSGAGLPIRVPGSEVSGGYFAFCAWSPAMGRGIDESDTRAGANRVVVLSDRFWRTEMGARPDVVGQSARLDGNPATIVGILPPDGVTSGVFVPSTSMLRERRGRRGICLCGPVSNPRRRLRRPELRWRPSGARSRRSIPTPIAGGPSTRVRCRRNSWGPRRAWCSASCF